MTSRITAKLIEVATEIDYLKSLRREIERNVYLRELKKLQKKEKDLKEDLDMELRSRQVGRQIAMEEEKKKKKKEEALRKKLEERRIRSNLVFQGESDDNVSEFLRNAYARTAGNGTLRIITKGMSSGLDQDLEFVRDITVQRPPSSREFIGLFFVYEGGVFAEYMIPGGSLMILKPNDIPTVRLRQMFREGIQNCVFTPILKKLNDSLASCKSKDSAKRYKQRIAKIEDMEELYSAGVPEDKMEEVAKASGYKIIIHNILGKEIFTFNEKGKLGLIKFTNTRPNHVDEGKIALDQDFEIVSQKEIVNLWGKAQKEKEFYMIEGDIKNECPTRLRLMDKAYRVKDPNEDYFDEMNEKIELNKYRLNATKYPEVNEFVKAGRIINAWVCPFSEEKATGHLDMPKAYSQFKKCDWYSGFLGVIHQFRSGSFDRKFIEEHIGIYRITIQKCENALFGKLGMIVGTTHILPSPEIIYFMDKGVEVSIDCGVWGSKFDFDFPDYMLNDRRYCLWSGRLGMERNTKKFSFHAEGEWASHLKADFGDDCYYWSDEKICSVRVPVKNVMTTHHIFAFITSYVRIQMMEAMSKFKLEQLVRVVMDGIYFVGEKPMGLEWFREKEIKENSRLGFEWYNDTICNVDFPPLFVKGNTLLTGQGGAGKTYKIMTDGGFNRILFVTPQHVLGGDVSKKYNVPYTTIHKLIGAECQPYHLDHSYPPVIFVDEITQIEKAWVDKVFEMYKDSLIILAGDLNERGMWFQTRNGKPGEFSSIWKPTGVDVVHVDGDRRSRDDDLRNLKIQVRSFMEKIFVNGDEGEEVVMKLWALRNFKLTSFADAVKMFQMGDCWIAGTHKTSNKLLENGVCSGWYKKGGFVSFEEKEDHEKRGSFTIHSFQGRTLETGKIFISIEDLFEYSMLYTAISRAVNFNQLIFVR